MGHPSEIFEYAQAVGQNVAEYRYRKWVMHEPLKYQWETLLDGTYAEEQGYPELEEELATWAVDCRNVWFQSLKQGTAVPVLVN